MLFSEMDKHVTIHDQLEEGGGPVVLINLFTVDPKEADQLLAAWAEDAAYMKRQPGFISTQLHRGIADSGAFLNYAGVGDRRALPASVREPRVPGQARSLS
jgi:quinol monooxygenase YgiN